ncbi:hypothetical protein PRUB_a0217 [Pseudoalteromonas rubra]|uniref:Uncharacterized protein n=1 Tax=Pseudoalteromonas rubra TaxID=43658 RepID=A0A8T0C529_9GAMM|nr:hypothetical protein PRUB_a0217 [Pseudoalteromonas rubra]
MTSGLSVIYRTQPVLKTVNLIAPTRLFSFCHFTLKFLSY